MGAGGGGRDRCMRGGGRCMRGGVGAGGEGEASK